MQRTGGKGSINRFYSVLYALLLLVCSACGPVAPVNAPTQATNGTATTAPITAATVVINATNMPATPTPGIPSPTEAGTESPQPGELARWGMGKVYQQILSPDDNFLVLGTATGIYVYDTATMQLATRLGIDGVPAKFLLFSPSGKYLAVAPSYVQVDVYDFASRKLLFTLGDDQIDPEKKNPDGPFFAFSTEESLLYFFMSENRNIEIHNLPDGKKTDSWSPGLNENYVNIYISNDGKTLICITSNSSKILDIKNKRDVNPYIHDVDFILGDYTISDDRSKLITNSFNVTDVIQLSKYDGPHNTNSITPENYPEISFPMDGRLFLKADISPNNNHAAFLTPDHNICIWSIPAMSPRGCLPKSGEGYSFLKFGPDSSWLTTATNSEIQMWNLDWYSKDWRKWAWLNIQNSIEDVVFSREGDFAILREYSSDAQGRELIITKWDMNDLGLRNGTEYVASGTIHTSYIQGDTFLALAGDKTLFFSSATKINNPSILVSGNQNGWTLQKPEDGTELAKVNTPSSSTRLTFSPDQKFFAFAYNPGGQLILAAADLDNQFQGGFGLRTLGIKEGDWQECYSLSVSNTGLVAAAVASKNGNKTMVGIWSTKTGSMVGEIHMTSDVVGISPDGSILAVQEQAVNDQLIVYDIHSPGKAEKITSFSSMSYPGFNPWSRRISALSFSPEGSQLAVAAGSTFGDIHIFETKSWKKIFTLEGHTEPVTGMVFSPDGNKLYSTGEDGTTRTWGLFTGNTNN